MPTAPSRIYTGHKLQPLYPVGPSALVAVNIQPSLNLAAGTVLGEVAATPGLFGPYGNAVVAAPSAPTIADGAEQAGTEGWPATPNIVGVVTYLTNNGETTPSAASNTLTPEGGDLVHFNAISPPAGVTGVNYYAGPTAATAQYVGTSTTGNAIEFGVPNYSIAPVYPPAVNTARTQSLLAAPTPAIVPTDAAGAGEWQATEILVGYTYYNAAGETTLSPIAEFTPAGAKLLHIAILTPAAGATGINYYAGTDESRMVQIGTSTTGAAADYDVPDVNAPAAPLVNTATTVTTGVNVAKVILADDVTTDANGNVVIGLQAANEFGTTWPTAPVYRKGAFLTTQLVGLDAAAVAELGRLSQGTVANGVLELAGG